VEGIERPLDPWLKDTRRIENPIVDRDKIDVAESVPDRRQRVRPELANRTESLGAQDRRRHSPLRAPRQILA
jgi:hypothetical protein